MKNFQQRTEEIIEMMKVLVGIFVRIYNGDDLVHEKSILNK